MAVREADIRELVGEVIVAGFDGTEVTSHARRLIETHRVKNIILFRRNVESAPQLTALNASLQDLAVESGHTRPLIICTDQENGIVRRVAPGIPGLPGNMAVGATGRVEYAYATGKLTAHQLLAMGVNMDLAPVLDVNNNPENPVIGVRSYGEDPDTVANFGAAMIRALQEQGVIACGKHFPGHGDTSVDSHLALPEIPHSRERLRAVELKPFLKAMDVGVDVLMTAHISFPAIDGQRIPATLSKAVLSGFLREELGYTGVITTDCLEMDAISQTVGVAQGAVQALSAGADMLMISHRLDRQEAAIEAIVQAVREGTIPVQRLVEAATRVRNLREQRLSISVSQGATMESTIAESLSLQSELSAAATTLVANAVGLVPVQGRDIQIIDVLIDTKVKLMSASDNSSSHNFIIDALRVTFTGCQVRVHQIGDAAVSVSAQSLQDSSLIVAGIHGTRNNEFIHLTNQLAEAGMPVVAFALQSPYDLRRFPQVPTQVAIYEYTPWMVQAGVNALVGKGGQGHLPVSL